MHRDHVKRGKLPTIAFAFLCLCGGSAFAAIDGTVMNASVGKPQPSMGVNLIQPGQNGMQKLGSTTSDAEGKFRFDQATQPGPVLLQVVYKGIDYNHLLTPGSPTTGVELDIYDSTANPAAKVTRDMILLEPSATGLSVSETVLYHNATKTTYRDAANGTFRFYVPKAAAGKISVNAAGPEGMPLAQTAEKTREPDVYKVNFPVKPGETRFDITYMLPDPTKFSGKVLHKEGSTNLVAPHGVTLHGDSVAAVGQEPTTQATVYSVKGNEYSVTIEGTGSLRSSTPEAGEDNGPPPIQSKPPRLYDRLYWILGLTGLILALGFWLLYRAGERTPAHPVTEEKPKRRK